MASYDDSLDDYLGANNPVAVSKQTAGALNPSLRQLVGYTRPGSSNNLLDSMRSRAVGAEAAGNKSTQEQVQRTIGSEFGNSATGLNVAIQEQANLGSSRPELEASLEAAKPGVLGSVQSGIIQNLQARPQQVNLSMQPYLAQKGLEFQAKQLDLQEESLYPPVPDSPPWWQSLLGGLVGGVGQGIGSAI